MPAFPKPANWDKGSALDRRAYQIEVQNIDAKMMKLLHSLPSPREGAPNERQRSEERHAHAPRPWPV
jgi:hypothetical protein